MAPCVPPALLERRGFLLARDEALQHVRAPPLASLLCELQCAEPLGVDSLHEAWLPLDELAYNLSLFVHDAFEQRTGLLREGPLVRSSSSLVSLSSSPSLRRRKAAVYTLNTK